MGVYRRNGKPHTVLYFQNKSTWGSWWCSPSWTCRWSLRPMSTMLVHVMCSAIYPSSVVFGLNCCVLKLFALWIVAERDGIFALGAQTQQQCVFSYEHDPVTHDDSKIFLSNFSFLFVLWLHFSTRQQKSPQHQSSPGDPNKSNEKCPLAQEFLWKQMIHVLNNKYNHVTKH